VISFTPRPLYPRRKSPRYAFYRRLGGPRTDLEDVKRIKILPLPGIEPRPSSPVALPTALSRLPNVTVLLNVNGIISSYLHRMHMVNGRHFRILLKLSDNAVEIRLVLTRRL
jgi:hypothetical protein